MKGKFMKKLLALAMCPVLLVAGLAWGQEVSVKSMPPSVIKTVPQSGDMTVDAAGTTQIKVSFSKEMMDGSWSWSQMSKETFPAMVGTPKYLEDKKTCVIDVKLEPNKTYIIWVNTQKFTGFKDVDGNSAVPYLLVFQTK
jgi:hypothetical protein